MPEETEKPRRTWVYVQDPMTYGYEPCPVCGNTHLQWSEFQKHIWCDKCEKDYIPSIQGVFDGPITVEICQLIGMCFDTFNLETQQVEKFELGDK